MERILKYFPNLTDLQKQQFSALPALYEEWNAMINVISRKDIDQLMLHHVLHSLAIAKMTSFKPGTTILDLGTGGGFPGIPLAIMFPQVEFLLVDGTGKKIKVVQEVTQALELKNVEAIQKRAEEIKGRTFDFVVSRAVAELPTLWLWSKPLIHTQHKNGLPNGLLALKGGNLKAELKAMPKRYEAETTKIIKYFLDPFFEEKYIVYVQR